MPNELRQFPVGIAEQLDYYVYLYEDPRDNRVFYVGKGQGDRVFAHLHEASQRLAMSRKVRTIRDIWTSDSDVIIRIHRHGLTENEAFHVEASLIQIFPDAANDVEGHHSATLGERLVSDLISEKQREPATIDFPAVLINIRRLWLDLRPKFSQPVDQERLYNATRTAWSVNPSRHPDVHYAICTAFGLVRQVYRIERWLLADIHADGSPREIDGRQMFEGSLATEKQHLIGKAVDHLQKPGAQNAIRWLDAPVSSQGLVGSAYASN